MLTLALDTSSARSSVALLRDDTPLGEVGFSRQQPGEHLFGALRQLLDSQKISPAQVDLFAIGIGPGSFTGIRAGIAAVKGLALPAARPIKSVPSFDAIARAALPALPRDCPQLCVLCDARRDEVCYAFYDRHAQRDGHIRLGPLESIADAIHNPLWFISPEIDRYRQNLATLFGGFAVIHPPPVFPQAGILGQLARARFLADACRRDTTLAPLYLRPTAYTPHPPPPS